MKNLATNLEKKTENSWKNIPGNDNHGRHQGMKQLLDLINSKDIEV